MNTDAVIDGRLDALAQVGVLKVLLHHVPHRFYAVKTAIRVFVISVRLPIRVTLMRLPYHFVGVSPCR